MAKFYALQIKMKKITLEDVPERWREAVEANITTGCTGATKE